MAEFRRALEEIYATQNKVILLMSFLRSLLMFLITYFVLKLFNFFELGLSAAVSIIYFGFILYHDINNRKLIDVERKNPVLWEKLRTAADYISSMNYVINRLQQNVLKSLGVVKVSSFLDLRRLVYISLIIVLFAGLNVASAGGNWLIYDLKAGLQSIHFGNGKGLLKELVPNSLAEADVNIEDLNADAELLDFAALSKIPLKRDQYLPDDIFEESDLTFEEQMPKKKRLYIRKYFSEIRKLQFE